MLNRELLNDVDWEQILKMALPSWWTQYLFFLHLSPPPFISPRTQAFKPTRWPFFFPQDGKERSKYIYPQLSSWVLLLEAFLGVPELAMIWYPLFFLWFFQSHWGMCWINLCVLFYMPPKHCFWLLCIVSESPYRIYAL